MNEASVPLPWSGIKPRISMFLLDYFDHQVTKNGSQISLPLTFGNVDFGGHLALTAASRNLEWDWPFPHSAASVSETMLRSTWSSQAVSHPRTKWAICCLASVFELDLGFPHGPDTGNFVFYWKLTSWVFTAVVSWNIKECWLTFREVGSILSLSVGSIRRK